MQELVKNLSLYLISNWILEGQKVEFTLHLEIRVTVITITDIKSTDRFSMCAMSLQLCLTLCDPIDYSLPGSSDHVILRVRTLERVAMQPDPGDLPKQPIKPVSLMSPVLASKFFPFTAT